MTFIRESSTYEFITCWICMRSEIEGILKRFKAAGVELQKRSWGTERDTYGNAPDWVVPLGKEKIAHNIISQLDKETVAETHRLLNRPRSRYYS